MHIDLNTKNDNKSLTHKTYLCFFFLLYTNPYDYEIGRLIIKYINMKLVSLAFQDHRNVINVQNNLKKKS